MELNFFSTGNATVLIPPQTLKQTIFIYLCSCIETNLGVYTISAFTVVLVCSILPLCIFILYLGHRQWKQRNSTARMSDSDFFTHHMVVIEIINVFAFVLCSVGALAQFGELVKFSVCLLPISFFGQLFFHILTCVERYLAVVHPITYRGLKNTYRLRIRNTILVFVWVFCLSGIGLLFIELEVFVAVVFFGFLPFSLVIISICSVVVLCVLKRSGPVVRERQRLDQSKLKAFHTIVSILGALLMRFGANIVISILFFSLNLSEKDHCGLWLSNLIMCVPCSLVLPLLFLHRTGKLPCCKSQTEPASD